VKIKTCRKCGFSWVLAKMVRFRDNGTIIQIFTRGFRLVLIEANYLTEIFQRIEEELGLPIMHIVFEAQRNASIDTINNGLRGPLKAARWSSLGKKFTVNIFCRLAVWSGQSYAKTVLYKPGKLGEAIVLNPFNRELMASIIVGAFEALERKPFSHTWKTVKGNDIVCIQPEPSRSEISERMTLTPRPAKKGNRTYPRCPGCGVPQMLNLEWFPDEGRIMDTRRYVRMAFLDAYTPGVVFRELAKELGDDVYPIIIDAQRAFSLRHLREEFLAGGDVGEMVDKDTFYISILDTMALRGQGNPVDYDSSDGSLSVVIENPFEEHCLAGMLSAMYMLGEGRPAVVDWQELDPSTLKFTLTPKA
jgi:hypothetical protein